jgi:hypothetical protein
MAPPSLRHLWRAARIALMVSVWLAPAALSAQSLSRATLSFGNQVVGQTSVPRTVAFKNTLLVPVTLTSVVVSGGHAGDFAAAPACVLPAVVQPGKTCAVPVRFTPGALGARSSTLIFAHNGPAGPLSAALTGIGAAPVTLTSKLSFGIVPVGAAAIAQTVTLTNLQSAPLSISSSTVSLPFWKIGGGTCPAVSGTLAAGASCTIQVGFQPMVAGSVTGALTVTHSAINSPQVTALSGKGVVPMTASVSSLSFTSHTVGTTSIPKTVTVMNRMPSPLTLTGIATSGDFGVASSTCGASLAAGAKCVIGVAFSPTAVGARTGALSISHSVFGSPLQIPLSGSGNVTGLVSLAVTPSNPSIAAGSSQAFAALGTFSNGSSASLTTSAVWSVSGAPGVASISNSGGTQGVAQGLAAGTATVTATIGTTSGSTQLTVTSGAPQSIDVNPPASALALGLTQQFTATATYPGGGTANVTATAEWDLEFPTRGRVNDSGLYTALASGANSVSATVDGVADQAGVTAAGPVYQHMEQATATRLLDGRVLIAGGLDISLAIRAQAEIFDPTTGAFTAVPSMGTPRRQHTATLLPDGRVLVVGGVWSGTSTVATAEIFDPVLGTWAPTGSMNTTRGYHSASLVGTKVLVAGGYNGSATLTSAELFDPSTGTFTYTGSLATARRFHPATRLPDGRVLVTGGHQFTPGSPSAFTASAEIYNPASGSWSATGSLVAARVGHTATLLPSNRVLVVGGHNGVGAVPAEVFDPATGTWSVTGSIAVPVANHTASLLPSGQVLVAGGGGADRKFTAVYDPASGVFEIGPPLAYGRGVHADVVLNNGTVLLVGGAGLQSPQEGATSAEIRLGGAVMTGLTLEPLNQSVSHPSTVVYRAIGTFSDGSRGDMSGIATWSVTPNSVAIFMGWFSDGAHVWTLGPGSATVRATLGSFSFETTLVVN